MKKIKIYSTILLILLLSAGCKVSQKVSVAETVMIKQAMLRAMTWQEANPIFAKAPTDWTNGAYYLGVVKAHQATKDKTFLDVLNAMAVRNAWKPWERFFMLMT